MARRVKALVQGGAGSPGVNRQWHRDHRSKKNRKHLPFGRTWALLVHNQKKVEKLAKKELKQEYGFDI